MSDFIIKNIGIVVIKTANIKEILKSTRHLLTDKQGWWLSLSLCQGTNVVINSLFSCLSFCPYICKAKHTMNDQISKIKHGYICLKFVTVSPSNGQFLSL